MRALVPLIRIIDGINETVGRIVAWLTLGTVLVCFLNVLGRYALGFGFIWMQELYVWQHAIVFVLGAGYTFLHGGHVRVDIFYIGMRPRNKAWVDIVGTVAFLGPFLLVIWSESLPFFLSSYAINESSQQPAGLPYLWLLKSTLLVFCVLVGLQGLAVLARSALALAGREEFAIRTGGH